MSGLKAFRIIQGDTGGYGAPSYKCDAEGNRIEEWSDSCEVYDKSEADAVIANRDYEIKKLKDSLGKLLKAKTEQIMDEVIQKTLIYGEGFVPVEHAMKLVAETRHANYKRCVAMSECRDAQSRWCYQAACTLPPGVAATLYGKPVMVEPKRLFRRSERLLLASTLWKQRAGRFSGVSDDR